MSASPTPVRPRSMKRGYLILIAAVLAGVTFAIAKYKGHLSWYTWLSVGLAGLALIAAIFVAIRTHSPQSRRHIPARQARADGISRPKLETANSSLSIVASLASIVTSAITLAVLPATSGNTGKRPETDRCAVSLIGPAHRARLSSSAYQGGMKLTDIWYSIYSTDGDARTAQLHSAMYGHLNRRPSRGQVIFAVGHWEAKSVSITTHVHGYSQRYYPRGEILPRRNGCWSIPSRTVGQPGSVGLTEKILFMLVGPSTARLFERVEQREDEGRGSDLTQAKINSLNITIVDSFELGTSSYNRIGS